MTSEAGQQVTLGDVLAIAPADDRLPAEALGLIAGAWGDRSATDIAGMSAYATARELLAVMPDGQNEGAGYTNADRFAAAEAIQGLLKRSGFAAPPAGSPQPMRVTLDVPKSPAEMPWRELLALLAGEPGRDQELRPYLDQQPQYRRAHACTRGALAFRRESGGLDVETTVAYIEQASRPHASAQRVFQGRRPVTLSAALGLEDRALIHPFTGRPAQGPDANGFDFGQLLTVHPGLNNALLWAAATGHSAWPQVIDLYTFSEQVFTTPLPHRWQLILDDYQAALADGDDIARIITPYWPEGVSLDQVAGIAAGFQAEARPSRAATPDYEQVVRERGGLAGTLDGTGNDNRYAGGVFLQARLTGNDNYFNGVIFVEGGRITGNDNHGNLLLPPGVRVRVTGNDNRINQENMTWKDLAEHLGVA